MYCTYTTWGDKEILTVIKVYSYKPKSIENAYLKWQLKMGSNYVAFQKGNYKKKFIFT